MSATQSYKTITITDFQAVEIESALRARIELLQQRRHRAGNDMALRQVYSDQIEACTNALVEVML